MSKMSDLDLDIRELLEANIDVRSISRILEIPVEWVLATEEDMGFDESSFLSDNI